MVFAIGKEDQQTNCKTHGDQGEYNNKRYIGGVIYYEKGEWKLD